MVGYHENISRNHMPATDHYHSGKVSIDCNHNDLHDSKKKQMHKVT